MIFPGSSTACGARHRASPCHTSRPSPVTRIVSHSKMASACDTSGLPSADTVARVLGALSFARKCLRPGS
jgi:hypothetical protein